MTREDASIGRERILAWLRRLSELYEENKEELTRLDAAIGDADHGINMDRGFKKVIGRIEGLRGGGIGEILKETALALISSVGGASGPLYGTLFLKASELSGGKSELEAAEFAEVLRRGVASLAERGKAKRGDKTMVDALEPAVEAFERGLRGGKILREALGMAEAAAERGMKDTVPLVARKGRASYMGERSAGHQDPGATSAYILFKALGEVFSA